MFVFRSLPFYVNRFSLKFSKISKTETKKYSGELDGFQPTCVQSHPIVWCWKKVESFYWLFLYSKYFCSVIVLLELLLLNQLALLIVKIIHVFWIIFLRLSVLKISVILTLSPLDQFVCFVRLSSFNGMNWNSEIRSSNHLGLRAKIKWFFW